MVCSCLNVIVGSQILQAFGEHYTVFYQRKCQYVMYFQSGSLGGSKYFHSETFELTFLFLSLCYTCVFTCVSFSALAKRTKASTQPCVWTKSSTSPCSWTLQWSVKSRHTIGCIVSYVLGTIWGSLLWFIALNRTDIKLGHNAIVQLKRYTLKTISKLLISLICQSQTCR